MSQPSSTMGLNVSNRYSSIPIDPVNAINIISTHVKNIKLFGYEGPDLKIVEAVRQKVNQGAQLKLVVGIANDQLERLSKNDIPQGLTTMIGKYRDIISCVSVGNEPLLASSKDKFADYLVSACNNVYQWLQGNSWNIGVTIAQNLDFVENSWPPSACRVQPRYVPIIKGTCAVMQSSGAPFIVNIYPYYAHQDDPRNVPLDYCLFKNTQPQFRDPNGLEYYNVFDAMIDALHAALAASGCDGLEIVIGECGWPTYGGRDTTRENAQIFNQNLINHCTSGKGTPLRPKGDIRCFLFETYNENLKKGAPVEPYWGWYYYFDSSQWAPKYPLTWV